VERLSENPRDLLMALGQLRASLATSNNVRYVNLYYQSFPGRFDLYLEPVAATTLAGLLRTKGHGDAGPIYVGTSRFAATGREIIMLNYRMGVAGQFHMFIGDDDARRVADELDAAVWQVSTGPLTDARPGAPGRASRADRTQG
jgi:hypothetical protein